MPGNKPWSSYKKKGKVFMVPDLRREKSTLKGLSKAALQPLMYLMRQIPRHLSSQYP